MVKTGVFKKIAALTAAVAMVGAFAASASAAVSVSTTTQYVADSNNAKINVVANVSGLGSAVEVTYYATNGSEVVYVDQTTASSDGAASFDYVTDATDLKSAVKVGYTAASAATDSEVPGYTISGTGITSVTVPTENINGTHILDYTVAGGYKVTGVTTETTGVTAEFVSYDAGKLTVTLAGATGDVALAVTTEENVVLADPVAEIISAAGIVSDGAQDEVTEVLQGSGDDAHAAEGDRKVSVLCKLLNVGTDYGVIISKAAITAADDLAAAPTIDAYAAKAKNEDGHFAVQLIDPSSDGALVAEGNTLYIGLYYYNPKTEKYVVLPYTNTIVVE